MPDAPSARGVRVTSRASARRPSRQPASANAETYVHRDVTREAEPGRPIASWARTWLLAQAVVYAVVGALLLFAREAAAGAWPWAVSETLAQFYGGAFLGLAYVSWHSARRRVWPALVAVVPPFLVFSVVTLVVSLVHGGLFDAGDPAAWAWFAFFGASAAALAVMLAVMLRAPVRPEPRRRLVGERRGEPVA